MIQPDAADDLYRLVGGRIHELRKRAGITQQVLAAEVGVSRTSITNVERGRQRLPLHQLLLVADVLRVELRELIPARSEIVAGRGTSVPVRVGRTEREVPPRTARMIERLLAGGRQ